MSVGHGARLQVGGAWLQFASAVAPLETLSDAIRRHISATVNDAANKLQKGPEIKCLRPMAAYLLG